MSVWEKIGGDSYCAYMSRAPVAPSLHISAEVSEHNVTTRSTLRPSFVTPGNRRSNSRLYCSIQKRSSIPLPMTFSIWLVGGSAARSARFPARRMAKQIDIDF